MRAISRATLRDRLVVRHRRKPAGAADRARSARQQAVGMRALQVALHALRAEHPAVEREVLPRLEADRPRCPCTLSWMPHCWPQKQQCVLTSFSGSSLGVEPRVLARAGAGRTRAMIVELVDGELRPWSARVSTARSASPKRALRQAEERAPAARADLLVVVRRPSQLVAEAELALDRRSRSRDHASRDANGSPQRRQRACSRARPRPCRSSTPSCAGRWKMWKNLPNGSQSSVKITVTACRIARKS